MSSQAVSVSVIICTRNRANSLEHTLSSLARMELPRSLQVELLIVDNGSTDGTRSLVERCTIPQMPVRYLMEKRMGKASALNLGLARSGGDIILFTDDDVRVAPDWIERMCEPIRSGQAQAVVGGIVMPAHLQRPWIDEYHRSYLACPEVSLSGQQSDLIGANMGFHRSVLDSVPAFDPELGPGRLGFADDTLFSRQLVLAGHTLASCPTACVEHHFDPLRLSRNRFLADAARRGRSLAYVTYHWSHDESPSPVEWLVKAQIKLFLYRARSRIGHCPGPGVSPWELDMVMQASCYRQYLLERKRPRNYTRCGLARFDYDPSQVAGG